MNPSQGLASDTLVRTTAGLKRVGDIQIGDCLYDERNRPTLCIGVAPPATGQLKKITYREFDSSAYTSFTCTPGHPITLTLTTIRACASRNAVIWPTRCDRKQTVKEACDLHLDILSDYFYHDLVVGDIHPQPAAVHAYVEKVLDQHYHPGHQDKYSKCIDDYLELAHAPGLDQAREAIHACMDSYLEQLSTPTSGAEADEVDYTDDVFQDLDSTDEVFDLDESNELTGDRNAPDPEHFFPEKPFVELDLPSSQSTHTYVPSSQPPPPDDDMRSSSPWSGSSSIDLDNARADRFATVRKSLDRIDCDCGGLRKVHRYFKNEEQAQLAVKILKSDLHHLIDPSIVREGEEFSMTVEEFEPLCCKEIKLKHLKLYRAPLQFDLSTVSTGPQALPLDPYFLGLWLGDGSVNSTDISVGGGDHETLTWLRSYVDRLNRSRPPHDKLYVSENLKHPAGTVTANGFVGNYDVFAYRIACRRLGPGRTNNPVLEGLRKLGILSDKSGGIPAEYLAADEDTRLAVIAGLIDSDGSYDKSKNGYKFSQMTEGHRNIVDDLKKLAVSTGISVKGVSIEMKLNTAIGASHRTPVYCIRLGKGSEKFQKYLCLPRKKMNRVHTYYNNDARPITISDEPDGEYRAIQVSGSKFQLANRLIV
ncbi:hypothetical protein V1517DRAFT_337990 [Lipomyces orientalis]|uniref:Uncharacterized protein n=1 Tax=Lipomyces orientalis TaxID=1233043 RepID=A0ACC3TR35_9ASCO